MARPKKEVLTEEVLTEEVVVKEESGSTKEKVNKDGAPIGRPLTEAEYIKLKFKK